jgi:hypothetical protein
MRKCLFIILLYGNVQAGAQDSKIVQRMKSFHRYMVQNSFVIDTYIHDSLTYGHSNGWIENAKEFRADLGSVIVYHSIREDSIGTTVSGKTVCIRFIADIDATLRGVRSKFRLRVLEVWVKSRNNWKIIARQAIKG